jgi:hypothetical protein
MCLAAWAEKIGIPDSTIVGRLERGWIIEDALALPTTANGHKYKNRVIPCTITTKGSK